MTTKYKLMTPRFGAYSSAVNIGTECQKQTFKKFPASGSKIHSQLVFPLFSVFAPISPEVYTAVSIKVSSNEVAQNSGGIAGKETVRLLF